MDVDEDLINLDHFRVISVGAAEVEYENNTHAVFAQNDRFGKEVIISLFHGTEDECWDYMRKLRNAMGDKYIELP